VFETTDIGGRSFGCARIHDIQTNATVVLLFGLVKVEFDLACTELQHSRNISGLPIYIPICLLELKAEEVDKMLQFCHSELRQVKAKIGLSKANPIVDSSDFDSFDFVTICRMLTALWATLAKCELTYEEHVMLLNKIGEYNVSSVSCLPTSRQAKRMKSLQKRIDLLRDWTQSFGPATKYLSQLSQAYVQTVSLLSNLENPANSGFRYTVSCHRKTMR
jgi:hypothetical protein